MIEFPTLNKLNTWRQLNSPTVELEVSGKYKASGFKGDINEAADDYWGGLVRTTIPFGTEGINTYIDGHSGVETWYYSVGMLCSGGSDFINSGIPAYNGILTDHLRLWSAVYIQESTIYEIGVYNSIRYCSWVMLLAIYEMSL